MTDLSSLGPSRSKNKQVESFSSDSISSLEYSYEPVPNNHSIRLLALEPSTSNEMSCRLSFTTLHDPPSYEALSYVWGDPSNQTNINCNGKALSVPATLAIALRRLRHESTVRMIWADAICINQQDIPERNQQVTLMSKIYSSAKRVISWLGDDNGEAALALKLIEHLQPLMSGDENALALKVEHPIFRETRL